MQADPCCCSDRCFGIAGEFPNTAVSPEMHGIALCDAAITWRGQPCTPLSHGHSSRKLADAWCVTLGSHCQGPAVATKRSSADIGLFFIPLETPVQVISGPFCRAKQTQDTLNLSINCSVTMESNLPTCLTVFFSLAVLPILPSFIEEKKFSKAILLSPAPTVQHSPISNIDTFKPKYLCGRWSVAPPLLVIYSHYCLSSLHLHRFLRQPLAYSMV